MSRVVGLDLTYHVKGGAADPLALQKMSAAFERAGDEFARFGEHLFPRVIRVLEESVGKQLEAEGQGPNRGKFAALSPRYAVQKLKRFGPRPLLVATGSMRDALTKSSSGMALRTYSNTSMQFGTVGVDYASFHQTGTERMTDRPPFDFGDETKAALRKEAAAAAREALKASHVDHFATLGDELDAGLDAALAGSP